MSDDLKIDDGAARDDAVAGPPRATSAWGWPSCSSRSPS